MKLKNESEEVNMNNLENSIKDCIAKEIEKGIIEKVIAEQLEKCIEKSISDMFSWVEM